MGNEVLISIPVSPEAASMLDDPARRQEVGRLVSEMLRPSAPEYDPLGLLIGRIKAKAHAEGLTDSEIDAELDAYNAERRL